MGNWSQRFAIRGKDWPPPFGFAIVNFAVFLGLMSRILGKPLKQMVRDRHDRIKNDLDEARKLREGAQAMLAEYQKKVENVDLNKNEETKTNWKAQVWWSHRTWEATVVDQVPDDRIVWRSKGQKGHVDGS